ncbi:HDOD domain-containing protein [Amphritea pacifica]|uniref:HDOD domain-containing protein n=1 Tax=Amphritea pacifica TaxID=2811233 RepID=A0ABS2WBA3_9GAMM|nr:HDOD domain-containing protein [Amphritea pacifica]MBN0988959.1 HDOD domain-containing protein [Amphritea pacifica]
MAIKPKPYLIPSRPEILLKLATLLKSAEPDVGAVVNLLKTDVSLYTVVLSTVNSPLFSRVGRRLSSLQQAVMRLGFKRLQTLITVISLKRSLSKTGRLDRFWDTSTEVAELAARLAGILSVDNPDEAYALGMVHDCGVPLMMESFSDYRRFLNALEGRDLASLSSLERQQYGVDHFTLGAEIAAAWHMPESVCGAIKLQLHYPLELLRPSVAISDRSKALFCLVLLAKDISGQYRRFWRLNTPRESWLELKPALEYLGLPDIDYLDIRDDCLDQLERVR